MPAELKQSRMPSGRRGITIRAGCHTDPEIIRDVRRLLMEPLWARNWDENFADTLFQWRFREFSQNEVLLAYDADRPIGILASYTRSYLLRGEPVMVREPSDWYCLPEYRCFGVGVHLMTALMDRPEPLLAIGGTEGAQGVLLGLGWSRLPDDVISYALPLTAKSLVSKLSRSLPFQLPSKLGATRVGAWHLWPRVRRRVRGAMTWRGRSNGKPATPVIPGSFYDLLPFIGEHEISWLQDAPPEMGSFFVLKSPCGDGAESIVIGRLYTLNNLRYARLIHFHTGDASESAYSGALNAALVYVNDHGADLVQSRASSPLLRRALEAHGFIATGQTATYWFSSTIQAPVGSTHLTFLRGDDAIRPYPE